jgi:peptide chain release factor subunit 1
VETLLLSEDLKSKRINYKCQSCGKTIQKTIKNENEVKDKICPDCNEKMKVDETEDVIDDLVDLAEEIGSDVEIISTETEEGMQLLKAFGGIGAILRYRP